MNIIPNYENIIITNLDFLLTLEFFKGLLKKNLTQNELVKLTEKFNSYFIYGQGILDESEKINIDIQREYTKEEVSNLILAIQNTIETEENDLKIKKITEIPIILGDELSKIVGGDPFELIEGNIKYGIFRGNEIIGFISGNVLKKSIIVKGLYINEKYRKKGLSTKLLRHLMEESIKKGLNRIDISNPSGAGQSALFRLAKKYETEGNDLQCEIGGNFLNNHAILEVNNKGADNSYFKNYPNDNFIKLL